MYTRKKSIYSGICFILILAATAITSCGRDSRFREELVLLDSVLAAKPDSVYNVLTDMRDEAMKQSVSDWMYYELMLADAQNKAYIDFTTDSVMKSVAEYYDNHGTANEKVRAYYLLGCTYRDLKDVPMELQYFQEAVEKADTTEKDCNWDRLGAIYRQMANLYHYQYLPAEELKALNKSEHYARLNSDTYAAVKSYELRKRAYLFMNMPDSVLSITKNSRKAYLEMGLREDAATLLGPAIGILIERGEYTEAEELMAIFEKESGYFDDMDNIDEKHLLFFYRKGYIALHHNNTDSARYCFTRLLECEKEAAYKGFLSLYEKVGNPDSITKYAKLYAAANDSSFLGNNAQTIEQMTAMYDYGLEKHNAEAAQTQLLKSTMYLVVFFVFVITIMVLCSNNRKSRRNTIDKIKGLNQEIEHKALLLHEAQSSNDDEELQALKASLDNIQKELQKYKKSDTLTAFFDSDIYKLFKNIGYKGNNKITSEEWETMYRLFNSTFSSYTDFIHSGKSMTEDQIKVCMLIRMGFGESEMASILDVDLKRISRIKMQINQKFFGVYNAKDLVENLNKVF